MTSDINNYKKQKENMGNPELCKMDTKITNLEGILTKTAKICHQLYSKKLKDEIKKHS